MKFTLVLSAFAFVILVGSSVVNAQTKSGTPPPPSLTRPTKAQAKGRRAIPPPPPISSIRVPRKRRITSSGHVNGLHTPGRDESGRIDLEGKPVPFYPVTKGVDTVSPKSQQSASKTNRKRGSINVNPAAPKPETYK